jgi:hypothetical protein
MANALEFVRTAKIGTVKEAKGKAAETNTIDVNQLPAGLVVGKTLLDLSAVPSPDVRAGISLSMLFASRVASNDAVATDEDSWLASYQTSLGKLGFSLGGTAEVNSSFKKLNVSVHKAIVPFLTIAFGGAMVGPVILAALDNLQKMDPDAPWITLFDREATRFSVKEMHFGAAVPIGTETQIRYAVARLNVELGTTRILFFKITNKTANFVSMTTSMVANNSLMAVMEEDLKLRLAKQIRSFIFEAKID